MHEGLNRDKVPGEHQISQHRSEPLLKSQSGTGVHQQYVDTRVREEEEQGGAEWAWSFVQDTPHVWSHAPGVRFFLTQHRTAPAVIGQRDDPRLAETPAPASSAGGWGGRDVGAGSWRVCLGWRWGVRAHLLLGYCKASSGSSSGRAL